MAGIASTGNSTSTTGPITRAMRPTVVVSTVAVIKDSLVTWSSVVRRRGVGKGVDATDDLADFLGDAGLASLVRDPGVLLDQLGRVVGRRLHRLLTGSELRG